jgi:hypothetical protein
MFTEFIVPPPLYGPLPRELTSVNVVDVTLEMSHVPFAAVLPFTPAMTTDGPFTNECGALVVISIGVAFVAPLTFADKSWVEAMVVLSKEKTPPPPSAAV